MRGLAQARGVANGVRGFLISGALVMTGPACDGRTSLQEEELRPDPVAMNGPRTAAEARAEPPVQGELEGEPFVAKSARFRVEQFPGRERVDLFLSEKPVPAQCAEPGRSNARSVWVRFPGVTRLEAGRSWSEQERDPVHFHYERREEGVWRGRGGGQGRVWVDRWAAQSLEGRIRVCFSGAEQDCVRGGFEAKRCRSVLDVQAAGGRTGTWDDAVEGRVDGGGGRTGTRDDAGKGRVDGGASADP